MCAAHPTGVVEMREGAFDPDRKSTRLNSSHLVISYAVFCLKKKKIKNTSNTASLHATRQPQYNPTQRHILRLRALRGDRDMMDAFLTAVLLCFFFFF